MYGGFRWENKEVPAHSAEAIEKMRGLAIGKIPVPFVERIFYSVGEEMAAHYWRLYSRTSMAPGYTVVQFRRTGLKSAAMLQNVFDLSGKHFTVTKPHI